MSSNWPFDQPADCAVISLRQILHEGAPILLVTHDANDHGWQFLDGSDSPDVADAMVVSFSEVVDSDPGLIQLADLPPGWRAWRESTDAEWKREEKPSENGNDLCDEAELAKEALAFPHPDESAGPKKPWWKFW